MKKGYSKVTFIILHELHGGSDRLRQKLSTFLKDTKKDTFIFLSATKRIYKCTITITMDKEKW